jgi:predicted nucleotidyltransferase
MDRTTALATLRRYEAELKAAGIVRLSLFGSTARGEASPESDVDLMAEFDSGRQFSCWIWSIWRTDSPISWVFA